MFFVFLEFVRQNNVAKVVIFFYYTKYFSEKTKFLFRYLHEKQIFFIFGNYF